MTNTVEASTTRDTDCHWLISDHVVFTTLNAIKDTVSYNHKEYEVQYG